MNEITLKLVSQGTPDTTYLVDQHGNKVGDIIAVNWSLETGDIMNNLVTVVFKNLSLDIKFEPEEKSATMMVERLE